MKIVKVYDIKENTQLHQANLTDIDLTGANLAYANLTEANLVYAKLTEANLKKAGLRRANLSDADLQSANLANAILFETQLQSADLSNANLSNTNLQFANLKNALLCEANLCYANLCYAKLEGSDLYRANLWGADLKGTCLDPTNKPNGNVKDFTHEDEYVIGYRTRTAGHICSYMDNYTYSADWFSTAETDCHPGLYIWPTPQLAIKWAELAINWIGNTFEIIKVLVRPRDVHKASDKWRCKQFTVIGKV